MTTPILSLDEISESQASKYITHNTALRQIEGFMIRVLDRDLATPPGAPSEGDSYLIDTSATGAWAGHDGDLTVYVSGSWEFLTPSEGLRLWVNDEDITIIYDGSSWTNPAFTHPDPHLLSTGSEGAPTYSFSGDSDTGMYASAANKISFTCGGDERVRIETNDLYMYTDKAVLDPQAASNVRLWFHQSAQAKSLIFYDNSDHYFSMRLYDDATGASIDNEVRLYETYTYYAKPASFASGSAADPQMTFLSDPDTGIFRSGTNELGISAGGTEMLNVSTDGIKIGTSSGPLISSGSGSPEGSVTAPVGSMYMRTDGGAGTSLYVKESGTGNTGWVGK